MKKGSVKSCPVRITKETVLAIRIVQIVIPMLLSHSPTFQIFFWVYYFLVFKLFFSFRIFIFSPYIFYCFFSLTMFLSLLVIGFKFKDGKKVKELKIRKKKLITYNKKFRN